MDTDSVRSPGGSGHSRAEPEEVSALRASVPNAALWLYAYAAHVSKHESCKATYSAVQGVRLAENDDEARGMAVEAVKMLKPDFAVEEVLILRVNEATILTAASAIEARRAETGTGSVADESAGPSGRRPKHIGSE